MTRAADPAATGHRRHATLPLPYRLAVLSRLLAAVAGGYALAAATAAAVGLLLAWHGTPRVHAVMAGTLLSFIVQACAALWVFGCASAWRAWVGLAVPTAALALLAWLLAPEVAA